MCYCCQSVTKIIISGSPLKEWNVKSGILLGRDGRLDGPMKKASFTVGAGICCFNLKIELFVI
jgi:hypothetical protein